MPWSEIFIVFLVSHMTGDFVLQTSWQATCKRMGLGPDRERRRALLSHVACYTAAFIPAFVWLATDIGGWVALVVVAIAVPHGLQDDGRFVRWWAQRVKKIEDPSTQPGLMIAIDQSFHFIVLLAIAIAVGS